MPLVISVGENRYPRCRWHEVLKKSLSYVVIVVIYDDDDI